MEARAEAAPVESAGHHAISRRHMLLGGAAATASFFIPFPRPAHAADAKIAIVGAGLAGLAAAYKRRGRVQNVGQLWRAPFDGDAAGRNQANGRWTFPPDLREWSGHVRSRLRSGHSHHPVCRDAGRRRFCESRIQPAVSPIDQRAADGRVMQDSAAVHAAQGVASAATARSGCRRSVLTPRGTSPADNRALSAFSISLPVARRPSAPARWMTPHWQIF